MIQPFLSLLCEPGEREERRIRVSSDTSSERFTRSLFVTRAREISKLSDFGLLVSACSRGAGGVAGPPLLSANFRFFNLCCRGDCFHGNETSSRFFSSVSEQTVPDFVDVDSLVWHSMPVTDLSSGYPILKRDVPTSDGPFDNFSLLGSLSSEAKTSDGTST